MGRGRREDLDVTSLREVGERADEVSAEACSVRLAQTTVRADVELGELGMSAIARVDEAPTVVLGADDLIVDVLRGANVDVVVGELLDQDRGEPDDDAIGHARTSEVVKQDKEREICPEDRLVYPFLTVGPSACTAGIRKVRMERQDECAHALNSVPRGVAAGRPRRLRDFVPRSFRDRAVVRLTPGVPGPPAAALA